jgi:DUF4097 and DUF4098 domain-containing protein YvlB
MRKFFLLAWAAVLPLLAVEPDFRWNGHLSPGQTIEIKGVNGGIHAEYATGSEIQVTARKSASHSDLNSVRVEVVPHAGGVTICTVYPSDGGRANECKPGSEGHMSTRNNDVKVDYTLQLPRGVRLVAKIVNGEVTANALQSDVEASTVNGRVKVATTGLAKARTVNGSIEASLGGGSWNDVLEFSTVNGSVDVTVPPGVNADVHASTVNGGLTTDFPLTVSGRWGPKSLNGKIGSGGPSLKLSTVNGGIRLHSATGRAI